MTIAGAIVLGGELVAIGVALGGSSRAAVILWLAGAAVVALGVVAYGSGQPGASRRLVEAVVVGVGAFLLVDLVDYTGLGGLTFALAYAAAAGTGTVVALPRRTPGRLSARLVAVAASAAVVAALEADTTVSDLGYFLPGLAVAAAGIGDVVVDTAERRQILVAAVLAVAPAALVVGAVLREDLQSERDQREQRVSAQPARATVGRERIAWRFPARGFNSGPLVAGEVVVADAYDALYGVDAETGEKRWRLRLPGREGLTTPVADGRTLFYPTATGVHAIDARAGRPRWRFKVADAVGVVSHRRGLVAATWEPPGLALYGLDRSTGRQLWRQTVDGDRIDLSPHPTGAVVETPSGRWIADARTGALRGTRAAPAPDYTYGNPAALRSRSRGWIYRPGWETATSEPLELDGKVFVNVDLYPPKATGGLHVLDERTGRLQWRVEIAGDSVFKPAARGDLVYVTSSSACADLGGCRSGLYAVRRR